MGSSPSRLSFRSMSSVIGATPSASALVADGCRTSPAPGAAISTEDGADDPAMALPVLPDAAPPDGASIDPSLPPCDAKSEQLSKAMHAHVSASQSPQPHPGDTYVINLEWRGQAEEEEFFRQGSFACFDPTRPLPPQASAFSSASLTSAALAELQAVASTTGRGGLPPRLGGSTSAKLPLRLPSMMGNRKAAVGRTVSGFVRVQSTRMGPPGTLGWTPSRRALEVLIVGEQEEALAPCDRRNHEQRLQERLSRLSLDMLVMAGDGNCQFRSISNELFGSPEKHDHVRRKAIEFMRQSRDVFEPFLGEDFDGYVEHMGRLGTWGDELTLRAVCDSYGITVHVVTSDISNWYLSYIPTDESSCREIFLTYIAPIHYNSIRRKGVLRAMGHRTLAVVGGSFKRLSMKGPPSSGNSGDPLATQRRLASVSSAPTLLSHSE